MTLVVGLVGLPSAGKSMMINALLDRRALQSGVCRTTTAPVIICNDEELLHTMSMGGDVDTRCMRLVSDDGVEFCAIDLPGIADSEDQLREFSDITLAWARKCDVVLWVTDARTALLTTHETDEFLRLKRALEETAEHYGSLFQFCIVLAKYEAADEDSERPQHCVRRDVPKFSGPSREITRKTEHSNIADHEARLCVHGVRIAKFSAFNRIARSESASEALKALVPCAGSASHTTFELGWATDNLPQRRLLAAKRALSAAHAESAAYQSALIDTIEACVATSLECGIRLVDVVEAARNAATTLGLLVCGHAYAAIIIASATWAFLVRDFVFTSATIAADAASAICATLLYKLLCKLLPKPDATVAMAYVVFVCKGWPVYALTCCVACVLILLITIAKSLLCTERVAFAYFHWAAEKGHTGSILRVAAMYESGRGVAADALAASKYRLRAAQRGCSDARSFVASMRSSFPDNRRQNRA